MSNLTTAVSYKSKKLNERIGNFTVIILLSIGALIVMVPFLFLISTSLKQSTDAFIMPPKWIPDPIMWSKYADIWSKAPFLRGLQNSLTVAVFVVGFGTFFSSLGAFAFSKVRFPMRNLIFMVLLSSLMIPFPVVMIPQFIFFSEIGWVNTLKPLIVPGMLGNVFMMFFIRQFMNGISDEIIEAGKIDGASLFGIYWRLMIPMVKPALAAQAILWFLGIWNDYLGPLLYISTPEKMTLQLVIASFNAFYAIQSDYPLIMAAALTAMVPMIVLFLMFQRYFVESLNFTAIKG